MHVFYIYQKWYQVINHQYVLFLCRVNASQHYCSNLFPHVVNRFSLLRDVEYCIDLKFSKSYYIKYKLPLRVCYNRYFNIIHTLILSGAVLF